MDTKHCTRCKASKPLNDFCRNRRMADGRWYYCKPCHRVNTREAVKRLKAWVDDQKARPCHDCGVQYPAHVMDCDHVPERGPKLFDLAKHQGRGRRAIQAELAKCDIVCANCHRIRTHQRRLAA